MMYASRMRKLATCLLLLTACASDVDPVAVAEVDVVEPESKTERSAAPVARVEEPPPSALDGWQLPGSTEPLGKPCERAATPDEARKGRNPVDRCGLKNRIALEVLPRALVRERPPCTMRSPESPEQVQPYSRAACVEGDHIVITSACLMCRSLDAGNAVHARLSELDAAQHAYLRSVFGAIEGEKPDTPEAWRALVAKGKVVARLGE